MSTVLWKRLAPGMVMLLAWLVLLAFAQFETPPLQAQPVATPAPLTCGDSGSAHYRACEVVLTGLDAELDALVTQAETAGIRLRPLIGQPPVRLGRRVVRLYQIHNADTTPVPRLVARLRDIARRHLLKVGADPNRVVGAPWEISGSPWQLPGGPAPHLAREAFESQWALQTGSGIGLRDRQGQRRTALTGAGIAVGVFDTAPYSVTASTPMTMSHAGVTFTLIDPPPVETPTPPTTTPSTTSSHGLFIVGLVYAVAPESRISLVRVLDDEGHGTVFRLHKALSQWVEWEMARPDFIAGVINLSLSVDLDYASATVLDNVETLRDVLDEAGELGFVVVTASGNGSTNAIIQPAQFPASHPGVISVSSVNAAGQRSCFANRGAIAAPGGDGDCAKVKPGTPTSPLSPKVYGATATPTPPQSGGCEQGDPDQQCLISFMQVEGVQVRYGYWAGTSFAAPLVSGLVALMQEQAWRERGAVLSPDAVASQLCFGAVPAGPALGYGRVDVSRTLALTPYRLYLPAIMQGRPASSPE